MAILRRIQREYTIQKPDQETLSRGGGGTVDAKTILSRVYIPIGT